MVLSKERDVVVVGGVGCLLEEGKKNCEPLVEEST